MSVEQVVLHLGFHKTGTTLLQRAILDHLPNALPNPEDPRSAPDAWWPLRSTAEAFRTRDPATYWDGPEGRRLGEALAAVARGLAGTDRRVILSNESLCSPDVFRRDVGGVPVGPGELRTIGHLRGLLRATGWDAVDVRVLLTVRHQAPYLAALFAQWSDREPGGQRAFERGVARWLGRPAGSASDLLDLDRLVPGLRGVVGTEAVTVLPLEAIAEPRYASDLADVLGIAASEVRAAHAAAGIVHRRTLDASTWALRRDWRGRLPGPVARVRQRLRRPSIRLTPELEARIRARYDDGNRRLDASVPFDLGALGYHR